MRLLRPIPLHWLALGLAFSACATADTAATPDRTVGLDSVEQRFANVARGVPYVGDSACVGCHAAAAETYARHSMARSFHAWTPSVRVESTLVRALLNVPTGYAYRVVDSAGALLVHIPDKGHVTTRYDGWYANRPRGMRDKAAPAVADGPPAIVPAPRLAPTEATRRWAKALRQPSSNRSLRSTRYGVPPATARCASSPSSPRRR
jgi:hypothetical protein